MTPMLTLQRRHSSKCPNRNIVPSRKETRCRCPLWACGMVDQRRVRLSLKTRDLQRAARRLTEIEDRISGKPRKTIAAAVSAFEAQHAGKASETKRKYKRILGFLGDFCASASIHYLDQMNVETMDRYSSWRAKTGGLGSKKLNCLRNYSNSAAIANGLRKTQREA